MTLRTSTNPLDHVRQLSAWLGPRPAWSEANHAAGDYIARALRAANLTVEEVRFDCPAWAHDATCLSLAGEWLDAAANTFSPPCDVTAPTVAVGTLAELEATDLAGRIVILYGALAQAPLTPKGCTLYTIARDEQVIASLETGRPDAVLTVSPTLGSKIRLIEDWLLDIPSATVTPDAGLRLLSTQGAPVHLRIEAQRGTGWSSHLIGRRTGPRAARIVLCAHYDTKIETPGAIDNAAGTAALLGLAERLAGRDLDCGLEIVAFGDEEYFGSDAGVYTARFGDTFGDILAVINLDAIGQQAGSNTITWMAHSDTFEAAARAVVARYPGVEWVAPWPESSHSFFAWQGVPAVALSAQGVRGLWHSPADGTQWLSADKLAEAVDLVADLVGILHDRPLTWTGPAA